MQIEIEGLSKQQRRIADRMWAMETDAEVCDFISQLPKRLRGQARLVRELMIAAALDQYDGDVELAKLVINSVK